MSINIGVIGGRGHTGKELLTLLADHPNFSMAFASSRALHGQSVSDYIDRPLDLKFESLEPQRLPKTDACVLALPNGYSAPYVTELLRQNPDCVICDLSADARFQRHWYYGLPEHNRIYSKGQHLISNPGCYATAIQLVIKPVADWLSGPAKCFGVSGYSGAGMTPSEKNDLKVLRDNLLPYSPTGHIHEREVSRQLARDVQFMPHVAPFFRGIAMTVAVDFAKPMSETRIRQAYHDAYEHEPLVKLSDAIPQVASNRGAHHAVVGGLTLSHNKQHLVVYATLDNLLKGAATQAVQNLNNAFDLKETQGIPHE